MTRIVSGPCGEKIGYYEVVEEKPLPLEQGESVSIRWLLSEKDGVPNFAMRLFTIQPGGHINAHSHPWEHEIYILEGVGDVRIGERVYRVTKGFFIYIPPNIEHEYWNTSNRELKFLCIIPLVKK